MKHGKQHWIPKSYSSAWIDANTPTGKEPYIWLFPKDRGEPHPKSPQNAFTERDMYTIRDPSGGRNLVLEHGLANLESRFAIIRKKILAERMEISDSERLIILAFVAAMQARTKRQRQHIQNIFGEVLQDMEAIRISMQAKTPEERDTIAKMLQPASRRGQSWNEREIEQLASNPMPRTLLPAIEAQLALLWTMDLAVLSTDDELGFITSDAPCVWFDPEANNRPYLYRAPGLIYPTIEVTLPLSPRQLILLNRAGVRGYLKVPNQTTDELNRRTRGHADEYFVGSTRQARTIWYEMNPTG